MNIEEIRDFCLSLPYATEDMAFGEDHLLFRINKKIFLCINLLQNRIFSAKCDPEYALELREHYPDIQPAWHWNKKYWNQVDYTGSLTQQQICSLIIHSYNEVLKKIPLSWKRMHSLEEGIPDEKFR